MNPRTKKILTGTLLLVFVIYLTGQISGAFIRLSKKIPTSEFVQLIEQNELSRIKVNGDEILGWRRSDGEWVWTNSDRTLPLVLRALKEAEPPAEGEEPVVFDEQEVSDGSWINTVLLVLSLVFMVAFILFIYHQMRGGKGQGGGGIFGFGKHKAKRMDGQSEVTFADVGGIDEVKVDVQEVVEFLKNPQRYAALGARPPKGTLLTGPPGVGKTLLGKAVAGEAGVPFFHVSGSEFVEMYVGVGAARVRDLFEEAKQNAPSVLFIDEIDAIGRKRGGGRGNSHDEREQTLNQILVELDGFSTDLGVVIMAATNRPDVLDPALLRTKRFDRQIYVPLPDVKGRRDILEIHIRNNKIPLADDVNLATVAADSPGMSGADLEGIVNEAALEAGRHGKKQVDSDCFSEAQDKVRWGSARKTLAMTPEDKSIACVHEIGHALIGYLDPESDSVRKITCIPRGPGLGMTIYRQEHESHLFSKEWMLADIRRALGGRVAEEVIIGRITTGADGDLAHVRLRARDMVTRFAMTDLGQMALGQHVEDFLGQSHVQVDYSEATAQQIDEEIRKIVDGCYSEVEHVIKENRDTVVRAAKELFERETLEDRDLEALFGPCKKREDEFILN